MIDDNISPLVLLMGYHPGNLHEIAPRGIAAAYFSMLNITSLLPSEVVVFDANKPKVHMTCSDAVNQLQSLFAAVM
eukprot:CAMPEP_0185776432 /NCGR_PEP_ID=MMETSP1174-20130828/85663_1 /TAXON_ID=35687 /ORGANISM="Dictyocha speculum, Strain CCMP1381" /LENGTH=75 /DNA_ID=CAMNT_0028464385 /DNA_START=171 /DNA_END=398 /DNA_ORIENTATION=-